MRVKTTRPYGDMYSTHLEVEKADSDGDVFIYTAWGGFFLNNKDISGLIKALRWAIGKQQ